MSINLTNPKTVQEKVDAAANYVAQIRIAAMLGDMRRVMEAVSQAERHLHNALCQIEEEQ